MYIKAIVYLAVAPLETLLKTMLGLRLRLCLRLCCMKENFILIAIHNRAIIEGNFETFKLRLSRIETMLVLAPRSSRDEWNPEDAVEHCRVQVWK